MWMNYLKFNLFIDIFMELIKLDWECPVINE